MSQGLSPQSGAHGRHRHGPSIVTNASGIAASAISFDTVTSLSAFPEPPSSIPPSPIRTHPPRTILSDRSPLAVESSLQGGGPSRQRGLPSPPHSPAYSNGAPSSYRGQTDRTKSSPYRWHEGASSIDVDPTEDIMLPTSLITDLLQRERSWKDPYPSSVRDGASVISEMTYPPVDHYEDAPPVPPLTPHHDTNRSIPRPHGSRPPPTSFTAAAATRAANRVSVTGTHDGLTDNETLISTVAPMSKVSRDGYNFEAGGYQGREKLSPLPGKEMCQFSTMTADDSIGVTSNADSRTFLRRDPGRQANQPGLQSSYSARAPSFMSKISTKSKSIKSIKAAAMRWMRKPLPPVPTIPNVPIADEQANRKEEESAPFSVLAGRAELLSDMLNNGYHPHHSVASSYVFVNRNAQGENPAVAPGSADYNHPTTHSSTHKSRLRFASQDPNQHRHRVLKIVAGIVFIALVIIIAVVVGVVVSGKHKSSPSACGSPNMTGAACNLDATCICTSPNPGSCDQLAKSVVDMVPKLNQVFNLNFTINTLSNSLFQAIGAPTGGSCAAQAMLIDVAPALSDVTLPNRTAWTQLALLWNVAMTEDPGAAKALQTFVQGTNWQALGRDGPMPNVGPVLSTTVSGYVFDFGNMTITQTPASFVGDGQPTKDQISQVGTQTQAVLDQMYTYSIASSTQQQNALAQYWRSTLQQDPSFLTRFVSSFGASPILIPFDATLSSGKSTVASLLTSSTSASFPPPVACYPGLNDSEVKIINTLETGLFGLPPASSATSFDSSCYSNRPVYGVLDVTRLRLPFTDSRTGVAQQAVVLKRDVGSRAVLYNGEILSALPNKPLDATVENFQANPRLVGTTDHLNHVILKYLSSVDISTAKAIISQVLANPVVPPDSSSQLYRAIPNLPTVEVAIFGSVNPSDVDHVVSSLSSPSGSLFFGTDQSAALRTWAITGTGSYIAWANSTGSPLVVRDSTLDNPNFNTVFKAASNFTHNPTSGIHVTVSNITSSFQSLGMFTPS